MKDRCIYAWSCALRSIHCNNNHTCLFANLSCISSPGWTQRNTFASKRKTLKYPQVRHAFRPTTPIALLCVYLTFVTMKISTFNMLHKPKDPIRERDFASSEWYVTGTQWMPRLEWMLPCFCPSHARGTHASEACAYAVRASTSQASDNLLSTFWGIAII